MVEVANYRRLNYVDMLMAVSKTKNQIISGNKVIKKGASYLTFFMLRQISISEVYFMQAESLNNIPLISFTSQRQQCAAKSSCSAQRELFVKRYNLYLFRVACFCITLLHLDFSPFPSNATFVLFYRGSIFNSQVCNFTPIVGFKTARGCCTKAVTFDLTRTTFYQPLELYQYDKYTYLYVDYVYRLNNPKPFPSLKQIKSISGFTCLLMTLKAIFARINKVACRLFNDI